MICYRFNCEQITSSKHARRVDPNRSGKARPMTGSGVARVSFHRRTADNLRRAFEAKSPRPKLLRQHKSLARARDTGPVAVEIGDQPLHVLTLHRTVQRGFIGELIRRLMNGGIADAPKPPSLLGAKGSYGIRQMLA